MVKWWIFWDSITRRRTDGALVRVITPVPDVAGVPAAEARMREFLAKAYPRLYYHIPQDQIAPAPEAAAAFTTP